MAVKKYRVSETAAMRHPSIDKEEWTMAAVSRSGWHCRPSALFLSDNSSSCCNHLFNHLYFTLAAIQITSSLEKGREDKGDGRLCFLKAPPNNSFNASGIRLIVIRKIG